ncbi:inorganic phosphate transporter [Cereibacter sphaeroides]|uniref:inorganic phosphate transporter n=1 Tax=Cereibacter sphaeroides TaxID=1063 RepID=UPI001F1EBFB9|nr:inorganic phosphate transporter [Cereibacter sphaeroides]MCE6951944.1 inorganic phosphate transporter [Cereibacter sphaeroides]
MTFSHGPAPAAQERPAASVNQWKTLDKDLKRVSQLERATQFVGRPLVAVGIALIFIVLCGVGASILMGGASGTMIIVAAAAIGAYMALNIGANDVANNMGPAVGANALTMGGALAIAAVFEVGGSLIAGGDVVSTISGGIVDPQMVADPATFIWVMMSALIAAAVWLNVATASGAPVSTTHSIVGGVMGSGIAAAGTAAVNWPTMGQIAASWVISPVLGAIFAAIFLAFIKDRLIEREDKIGAARFWVPLLIGVMCGTFTTYIAMKGLRKLVSLDMSTAILIGLAVGVAATLLAKPYVRRQSEGMENRKKSLKKLFGLPLVISAALLSFAHGANDVANAVGPLAAIVHTVSAHSTANEVAIPFWVMAIGAAGISFGLVLFGPKLIRMVGTEITKLNPMRAYCVALSAAITVIVASALGLPVSSTHIAVGGVFGVGFFREWYAERKARALNLQKGKPLTPEERKRRKLVRRAHFLNIAAAWVITVPATAGIAALLFLVLDRLG